MTDTQRHTQAENILAIFGGVRPTAAAINAVYRKPNGKPLFASTVQRWKQAGTIPDHWHGVLMEAAIVAGKRIVPSDFVEHLRCPQ
jgi:hypothetical protein